MTDHERQAPSHAHGFRLFGGSNRKTEDQMANEDDRLRELVANVAASYFSNSHVAPSEIAAVVAQIASSLRAVATQTAEPDQQAPETPEPEQRRTSRAQIAKSISPDALISFEDGKKYKTLRRHLGVHGLTPDQYRQKWGLPSDYPMVAPNYSAARSEMAKSRGLGRRAATPAPPKRRRRTAVDAEA